MKKAESEQGVWCAKTEKQTSKQSEKEIVIELPIPTNRWTDLALLEILEEDLEEEKFLKTARMYRIFLEKEKQTRTIRITGKNVDDLDLEKLTNMIQQANDKASKLNLRGLLKRFKRSHPTNSQK